MTCECKSAFNVKCSQAQMLFESHGSASVLDPSLSLKNQCVPIDVHLFSFLNNSHINISSYSFALDGCECVCVCVGERVIATRLS